MPISCHDARPAGVPEQRDEGQPATAAAAVPAEPAAPGVAATASPPLPAPAPDTGPAGATVQAAPSVPAAGAPAPPAASGQAAADPAGPPAGGAAAQPPSPPAGAAAAASTPAASAPTSDGGAAGPGSSGKKGVQHKTPFQKEALEAAFSSAQRALGGAALMPPWPAHPSRALLFFVLVLERESQRPVCGWRGGWGRNTAQLSPSPPYPPAAAAVNQYPTEDMKRVLGEKINLSAQQVGVSRVCCMRRGAGRASLEQAGVVRNGSNLLTGVGIFRGCFLEGLSISFCSAALQTWFTHRRRKAKDAEIAAVAAAQLRQEQERATSGGPTAAATAAAAPAGAEAAAATPAVPAATPAVAVPAAAAVAPKPEPQAQQQAMAPKLEPHAEPQAAAQPAVQVKPEPAAEAAQTGAQAAVQEPVAAAASAAPHAAAAAQDAPAAAPLQTAPAAPPGQAGSAAAAPSPASAPLGAPSSADATPAAEPAVGVDAAAARQEGPAAMEVGSAAAAAAAVAPTPAAGAPAAAAEPKPDEALDEAEEMRLQEYLVRPQGWPRPRSRHPRNPRRRVCRPLPSWLHALAPYGGSTRCPLASVPVSPASRFGLLPDTLLPPLSVCTGAAGGSQGAAGGELPRGRAAPRL